MSELRVHLAGYPDSDAEERAELAGDLRRNLLELDIDDVSHPVAAAPPPGAKGSALEWAQLIVTFGGRCHLSSVRCALGLVVIPVRP